MKAATMILTCVSLMLLSLLTIFKMYLSDSNKTPNYWKFRMSTFFIIFFLLYSID